MELKDSQWVAEGVVLGFVRDLDGTLTVSKTHDEPVQRRRKQ